MILYDFHMVLYFYLIFIIIIVKILIIISIIIISVFISIHMDIDIDISPLGTNGGLARPTRSSKFDLFSFSWPMSYLEKSSFYYFDQLCPL